MDDWIGLVLIIFDFDWYKESYKYNVFHFGIKCIHQPPPEWLVWSLYCTHPLLFYKGRHYHFCMTFDLEKESYICYAFWVPYKVYIKDFSKFHHFTLVLSSWWFSIHLLELKIQMWRIPPCHTSKVASWHVDYWYELHLWSSLSKIWLKVSKSGKNGQYCR